MVDGIKHETSKKGAGSVDRDNQYIQSLFYKELLYILDRPSIKQILPNGTIIESNKDEGLLELEGYRYDKQKSEKTGINCYVKEKDHSRDGLAYIIDVFKETGRAPVV